MTLENNSRYRTIVFCIVALLVTVFLFYLVYPEIDRFTPPKLRGTDEVTQEIETPGKLFLNGYLGPLFRFKSLGNINWMVLPLLGWFLFSKRKKERWQMALLFVWVVSLLFICLKAYTNSRYQMTIFPFTSVMTLYLLGLFLENKTKGIKTFCISLFILVSIFNVVYFFSSFKKTWDMRVSLTKSNFPYKIVNYLKNAPDLDSRRPQVFTFNQPIFYYHTNQTGIDSTVGHMVDVWIDMNNETGTTERIYTYLKKYRKMKYIFIGKAYKLSQQKTLLEEFLECDCKLFIEDNGWLLYRIRSKPIEEEILEPGRKVLNIWNKKETTAKGISPVMQTFSQTGNFSIEAQRDNEIGRNIIVFRCTDAVIGKKEWFQFGYELPKLGVNPKDLEHKYITAIVRMRTSSRLLKSNANYVSIMDHNIDGTIQPEPRVLYSTKWRTYILSAQMRPALQNAILLFQFSPKIKKDFLAIQDIKLVISSNPL